jgi:signal peptidase I
MWKKAWKFLLELVQMVAVSVILAVLINLFLFQPVKVEGESMQPTLLDKDFVILSRIGKTFNSGWDYGDIVVIDRRIDRKRSLLDDIHDLGIFNRMENRNLIIKRIIGLPGDIIEIRSEGVYRNGDLLEEPYLVEEFVYDSTEYYIVPEDHVFVLGDNRKNSMDSRTIGFIPIDNIKGTMVLDISKLLR